MQAQKIKRMTKCAKTGKLEEQQVVSESEDGITLKCLGCGKVHSHEIGEFAIEAKHK